MTKTVVFAGGGTGGHVMPIASLIEYLHHDTKIRDKIKDMYRLGGKGSLEENVASRYSDLTFFSLPSGKLRRDFSLGSFFRNLLGILSFCVGFYRSFFFLLTRGVDVVFCKGGHAALPVVLSAAILRKKMIVHESDTVMGLTNRIASRFATKIWTGFPGDDSGPIDSRFDHIGQLLSPVFASKKQSEVDKIDRGSTILVLCGSQGSQTVFDVLYTYFLAHPESITTYNRHIVTGILNESFIEKFASIGVDVRGFLSTEELLALYPDVDRCIARGSATSLAEQKLFGIHHLIIPLPHSGGNHQVHNASFFSKEYGDIVLDQSSFTVDKLASLLEKTLQRKKEKAIVDRSDLVMTPLKKVRDHMIS